MGRNTVWSMKTPHHSSCTLTLTFIISPITLPASAVGRRRLFGRPGGAKQDGVILQLLITSVRPGVEVTRAHPPFIMPVIKTCHPAWAAQHMDGEMMMVMTGAVNLIRLRLLLYKWRPWVTSWSICRGGVCVHYESCRSWDSWPAGDMCVCVL